MTSINKFNQIKITLANPDQIKNWSYGEVKKAETISFRTHKPEKDGLFDERIFGPIKDFECSCGKYKNRRFKGIVCEKCGVEITSAKVRRDRMGHIDLVTPIAHIWFTKSAGGKMASLIGIPQKYLESIIYYSNYVITNVDDGARSELLGEYQKELKEELVQIESIKKDKEKIFRDKIADLQKGSNSKMAVTKEIQNLNKRIDEIDSSTQKIIGKINLSFDIFKHMNFGTIIEDTIDEFGNLVFGTDIFKELTKRYHECFSGSIGAEAVKIMLDNLDMDKELAEAKAELQDQIEKSATSPKIKSLLTRVETLSSFIKNDIAPSSMIMDVVPVLPPELRPIVNLDGGRFATSDLNDLYRRVINRNNRLKKLLESDTIDIVVNNEKRMLQEAVDALFDNGKRGRIVTGTNGRPLKSLSEILKGKQGRFRQNLLGKRVDYSGRSVIVVGPELKLHQCGLPKKMALELFKPYIEHALIDMGYANSPRIASKFIESQYVEV
ncbi:MAG: DNA-directed RNA polymerase subunit beta', partial [Bifidobacteriaceae bacterium]|nr:DNA-directed RNA polymerase subunit beta' [Bifidobacteriaceae bacterium]